MWEHALHGFTNRDLRQKLARTVYPVALDADNPPLQIRRIQHLRIARCSHSRQSRDGSRRGADLHCRQHFLNFFPLPPGRGSFGRTLRVVEVDAAGSVACILAPAFFTIS